MKDGSRIIFVSNRLPVTIQAGRKNVKVEGSIGGLATGLRTPHEKSNGLWFGWPGSLHRLSDTQKINLEEQLASMRLVPIDLSNDEVQHYYQGFSNGVLWPLFHYLLDRIPLDSRDWEEYCQVNQRFADIVAEQCNEDDLIWIHDYQLMLVPSMLRKKLPHTRIGFFLHIPFPAPEVFRLLPWRAEILKGLIGADLIGFHTHAYMRHFAASLLGILGLEVKIDHLWYEERKIQISVCPMGIDATEFEKIAQHPETINEVKAIQWDSGGGRIILGVDRLDYTKGIPRRLLAFERLLDRDPSFRGQVRLIQVAVPSRGAIQAYEQFKRQVDELVGRINGKFGTAHHVPIHYIYRALSQRQLTALYCAADVMAVTPLRDGLNLVAKEFVASRYDLDGVLVLSEFAGAAAELNEAILVNPYDIDGVAAAFAQSLRMDPKERAARLTPMRERVKTYDVHRWVNGFLETLTISNQTKEKDIGVYSVSLLMNVLLGRAASTDSLVLFLDYDGTLRPLVKHPDLAAPENKLVELLNRLAKKQHTVVHIVSGRERKSLDFWLGKLPLTLHAEHGLWSKNSHTGEWTQNLEVSIEWKAKVLPILEEFTRSLPGSFIEEKSASIAWHYRQADPESGAFQAKEIRLHLMELLSNTPVEVIAGEKVVEVRVHGINKGNIVSRVLSSTKGNPLVVAIGDDRTDEDLFAAILPKGISIHVGSGVTSAPFRLLNTTEVHNFLEAILHVNLPFRKVSDQ